jgi:hypothetical protein
MPLCRAATQTGCVVAYSSFRVTAPPAASTRFGLSADSTLVAACTNPAALGGGEAALDGYFDATGELPCRSGPQIRGPLADDRCDAHGACGGLLKAQCRSNAFASYLEVSVQRGPGSPASRDIQGDLAEGLACIWSIWKWPWAIWSISSANKPGAISTASADANG